MCLWAQKNSVPLPDPLPAFVTRMKARPAVRLALEHEGLAEPAGS
jgi:glutathione S-transferase